ncbi:MAG: NAD-binding protein, partial [Lachnospiraceae bacterium]|nr:NAD-binding protein [Lachnospiraceae bacterium]
MFKQKNSDEQGLKIIIVGCGKVGRTLLAQLTKEGHDITLIDHNAQKIQELTGLYDVMGIVGNGASFSVQMEAGIENADLIISVTDSDELNLLCCTVAKRVGNCSAIARVRTPDYSKEANYLREKLGLAMIINPELEAAREAARILFLPTALEVSTFAHGQAEMVKFKVPDGNQLDGMTIMELGRALGKNIADNILICAVERDKDIHIPSGNFHIQKGDLLSFVAPRASAKAFLKKIGFKTHAVKNTM